MKKHTLITQIVIVTLLISGFIACDKDFTTLDSDIINNENATTFNIKDSIFNIVAYTKPLGPVQTNNVGLSQIGTYEDEAFGVSEASFVTQVSTSVFDPTFGYSVIDSENDFIMIDSVILNLPFFSTVTDIQEDNTIVYELDSLFGPSSVMKLQIYESNYLIRDFDPNSEFSDVQPYFSNQSASTSELISDAVLTSQEIEYETAIGTSYTEEIQAAYGDNTVAISNTGFVLTEPDSEDDADTDPQITQRQSPGIRLRLKRDYWLSKIIEQEGQTVLSSSNNFSDYFRGLYFRSETVDGSKFLMLNTASENANITIYYKRFSATNAEDEFDTDQESFTLNFGQNSINFIDNSQFPADLYAASGNENQGDSRLYVKGGEGAIAKIKLFNGDDINSDDNDMTFDTWKDFFVETDEDGNFVASKRLINEANLIFYVDQNEVGNSTGNKDVEPNRMFIYDSENNTPLLDYFLDGTVNNFPEFSIVNHLGFLERLGDDPKSPGIRYKFRITEHINNLLLRDSTNVELGLAVSTNVNLEDQIPQRQVQTSDNSDYTVPISTVISPRGTVLFGSNIPDGDINADKKVYLEIYYTDPQD